MDEQFDYSSAEHLASSGAWVPLLVLIVGYLVRLTATDSKFPITVPHQWHAPLVVGLVWALAFLRAWPNWHWGLQIPMLVTFLALAAKAALWGREPAWFRKLAFVYPFLDTKAREAQAKADAEKAAKRVVETNATVQEERQVLDRDELDEETPTSPPAVLIDGEPVELKPPVIKTGPTDKE